MFTKKGIMDEIDKLKPSISSGPSGFSNRFLKDFKAELVTPLKLLFTYCLQNNYVPYDWKIANVTPIFKKGQKSDPANYRPVSLTCVICKLFERLLQKSIVHHLESNNLIANSQHGFRQKRSCTTNLLEFLDYVTKSIDDGEPVDVIYYDFAKAFDKVSTKKLMSKLKSYGIQGNIFNWIENWLNKRKQRTVLNGESSDWIEVMSGVPQGSVLGPLLFIIFIDDIDIGANSIDVIKKFADDTKTGNRVSTLAQHSDLQGSINNLFEWSKQWSMKFNEAKCKVLHFGRNNPRHAYQMNGVPLQPVDVEKDIGVNVTSNLKPTDHCAKAAATARSVLYRLLKTFHYRDKNFFVSLYKTYVRPHMEFASPVWNPWLRRDIDVLERVQEKFVRNISGLQAKTYEDRLIEIELLSLSDRRIYLDLIEVFKILKGYVNLNYRDLFTTINDANRRSTRMTDCPYNIVGTRCNLDVRKNFFTMRIVGYWNDLPLDIKMESRLVTFKNKLKQHLLDSRLG